MTLIIGLLAIAAVIVLLSAAVTAFYIWIIFMARWFGWVEWKITGR